MVALAEIETVVVNRARAAGPLRRPVSAVALPGDPLVPCAERPAFRRRLPAARRVTPESRFGHHACRRPAAAPRPLFADRPEGPAR